MLVERRGKPLIATKRLADDDDMTESCPRLMQAGHGLASAEPLARYHTVTKQRRMIRGLLILSAGAPPRTPRRGRTIHHGECALMRSMLIPPATLGSLPGN